VRAAGKELAPPVIGINATRSEARWAQWHQQAYLVPIEYATQVASVGGTPVLLVPGCGTPTAALGAVDGLILSGGADVDPLHYAQPMHPMTVREWPSRDSWELDLARIAHQLDLPTLGICRGMQLLNVARGGTLLQHLADVYDARQHLPDPAGFGGHVIHTKAGSLLRSVCGARMDIAAHHHQAIDVPGHDVVVSAWASDGCPEGIEIRGRRWMCGVQGHPEKSADSNLFRALVRVCEKPLDPVV